MLIFLESLELEQTDKEFIVWLYHEYKGLMYYTANKYISFPEEIEDILQDSIIKLIEKIELLRDMEKHTLAGYIAATIRNTSFKIEISLRIKNIERASVPTAWLKRTLFCLVADVSQILCKHRKAVKNRAKIIDRGGGLSATP